MQFARKVWHLLVAIKDGLVLLLLVLFFAMLHALLTARGTPAEVRGGALLIALNGRVVEEPEDVNPWEVVLAGTAPMHEYRERDLIRALRAAVVDDRIKAVSLDLSKFAGGGQVHMQEIGAELDKVRAAGKPVLAFGQMYGNAAMLLASHASEIWVDPLGGVFVSGPGGHSLYYGKLLERLKVNVHVFRVGTYKDFVEPYIRNDMSEASRAARQELIAAVWKDWQADVARARPEAKIAEVTADPVGWYKAAGGDGAKAALAAGLVDAIGDRAAFGARMVRLVGEDRTDNRPGNYANTPLAAFLAAHPESRAGKAIGVVTVAGDIIDDKAGPGTAGGDRIARLIDDAARQDIAALVVRVDSPGGSVTGSEAIRTAILRVKAKGIPVAVSMANYAASGGYWVSTPGARVFARDATITGSIGIFAIIPSFENLAASWGVTTDGVRATPLSGQPDLAGGLTPEVEAILQANIENGYGRFVGLVANARRMTPEQVDAVAQGRVWDGATARAKGLVDEQGGLDEAMAWAAKAAKLDGAPWHPVFLGRQQSSWERLRDKYFDDDDGRGEQQGAVAADFAGMVAMRQQAALAGALAEAARMLGGAGVQARCLDCPVDESAGTRTLRQAAVKGGWLGVLARLF